MTMSSSKIIKLANSEDSAVSEFSFKIIGHADATVSEQLNAGHFVPMNFFQDSDVPEEVIEEIVDAGPAPLEIFEEDLNQRINDAFNQGHKEGKELAERGLLNVFNALRSSSETIHNLRDKIFRESEEEIINLVMLVARKVIVNEIAQDRSILAGVVQHALAGLSGRDEITVHINPDDYLLATSGRDELLHSELINERLTLKPDPSIAAGFCIIDTSMGVIDASLDSQLDQIYRTLIEQRTAAVAAAAVEGP
jgi:flagellar assembly protein FliH